MKAILLIISITVLFLSQTNAQVFTNYTSFNTATKLSSNSVNAIAIDADGSIWFGTNNGVSKFDGTTWTTYTTDNGLVYNRIRAITIDANGNKWFGICQEIATLDSYSYRYGGVSKLSNDNVGIKPTLTNENHINIYPNPNEGVFSIEMEN